jgi:predicted GTPase
VVAPKGESESVFGTRHSLLNDMPDAAAQITNVAGEAIRRYDDLKLEVAAIAQAAMLRCAKGKDEEDERAFQQLLTRLAEDRFNLAVVGPFSRGKSSLMNAILGFDALPTGLLPHTSVITTVTYGPRERVLIRCEGWSFPQEIRLDHLEEYVTERGNAGNRRHVAVAEIQLPVEILRRGLHFIDTPGVGSAILANTDTTEKFLPEIDAAIFVSSFDSAVSEADIDFLARIRATVGVVFLVLNKLDLVSESEREEVVRFVRERCHRDPRIGPCALFPVSAKRGLEAKLAGDAEALACAGLPELEAALAHFLTTDKARQLGARITDRLIAGLRRQQATAEFLLAANESPQHRAEALQDLDTRLAWLRARLRDNSARLEALSNSTLRALEPRIAVGFQQLKETALKKFAPAFRADGIFLNRATLDRLACDMSALCRDTLDRELRLYEASANEEWQREAGLLLAKIRSLPHELVKQTENENDFAEDSHAGRVEADGVELKIGQIAPVDCQPHLQWWVRLVPTRWFGAALGRRIGEHLDRILAHYRNQLESALRREISSSIDDLTRQLEKAIDARAEHIRQSLIMKGTAQDRASLDELLRRARKLKSEFGSRARPAMPTDKNGRADDADRSHEREGVSRSVRPCPVCRAIVETVFGHLSKLQYKLGMEASAQKDLADSGGLCSTHTWIYSSLTSPVGISRAYPLLLDSHATNLEVAARTADSLELLTMQVAEISRSERSCPVCSVEDRTAREAIRKVVKEFDSSDPSGIPALCLPHIELALKCGADLNSGRLLARATARALSRVADDMRRYGLKHDALRRNLMTSDEREAGQIGLRKLVGEMLLVLPPRGDDRL